MTPPGPTSTWVKKYLSSFFSVMPTAITIPCFRAMRPPQSQSSRYPRLVRHTTVPDSP